MKNKKFLNQKVKQNVEGNKSITGVIFVAILLLLVCFSSLVLVVSADEGTWDQSVGTLAYGYRSSGSVWYDNSMYIFGGYNDSGSSFHNEIIRYFPYASGGYAANTTIHIDTFPTNIWQISVGLDTTKTHFADDVVWCIGGHSGAAYQKNVYCFSFTNNTVWDTGHDLDVVCGFAGPLVVDDNGLVYLMAGTNTVSVTDTIKGYNHTNGTTYIYDTLTTGEVYSYGGAYSETDNTYYMLGGKTSLSGDGSPRTTIVAYCFDNNTDWALADTLETATYSNVGSAAWDSVNNDVWMFGGQRNGGYSDNVVKVDCDTNTANERNNLSAAYGAINVCFGHNETDYLFYLAGGTTYYTKVRGFDIGSPYSGSADSSFWLSGMDGGDRIHFPTTNADNTVWSNASASNGVLLIHVHVAPNENCTNVRIYCDDLDDSIEASNMTITFSSDNATWGTNGRTFTNGGNYIYINDSVWSTGNGCYGSNPFPIENGASWQNETLYARIKLTVPVGVSGGTYTQDDWEGGAYIVY